MCIILSIGVLKLCATNKKKHKKENQYEAKIIQTRVS